MSQLPGHIALTGLDGAGRLSIWQRLIDSSTVEERETVLRMISTRNDMLPTLPVELIIDILDHLPLFESFRLRSVCRAWNSLFSMDSVVRTSLLAWETHRACDSARDALHLATQTTATKLRHVQAMRCGLPFSQASYEERDALNGSNDRSGHVYDYPQLKGSRMAIIRGPKQGGNSVVVRHLVSGERTVLYGDARESIINMSLSSTLIAFTTFSGKLYAQDFSPGSPVLKSVRLPSAGVMTLHADHNTVAVMIKEPGAHYCYSVVVFDFDSGSLKSISNLHPTVAYEAPRSASTSTLFGDTTCISSLLVANHNDKVIDTFDYAFEEMDQSEIYVEHNRYSFREEMRRLGGSNTTCKNGSTIVDPSTPRCSPSGFGDVYNLTLATDNVRAYRILNGGMLTERASLGGWHNTWGFIARFDYRKATLAFYQEHDHSYTESPGPPSRGIHQVWKDIHIHRVIKPPMGTYLLKINTKLESARGQGRGFNFKWLWQAPWKGIKEHHSLHVNESFVVACYIKSDQSDDPSRRTMRVLVACFEEDLPLADSERTGFWDRATAAPRADISSATYI